MQDGVRNRGRLVVERFDDDDEALRVGGHEGGEVRDERQGPEVGRVRDLQRLHQRV